MKTFFFFLYSKEKLLEKEYWNLRYNPNYKNNLLHFVLFVIYNILSHFFSCLSHSNVVMLLPQIRSYVFPKFKKQVLLINFKMTKKYVIHLADLENTM